MPGPILGYFQPLFLLLMSLHDVKVRDSLQCAVSALPISPSFTSFDVEFQDIHSWLPYKLPLIQAQPEMFYCHFDRGSG